MEPTEASNLDDQYKYYWEGDLCDHAGQEGGPPPRLCIRSCLAGGGAVGCRALQNLLCLLRAGSGHQSLVISTWLPGLVSSAEPEGQRMSSEHLESSASGLSSKAWPLCWVQRSVDPLILLLLHSRTLWKVV